MRTAALQTNAGVITIAAGGLFALPWLTSMVFGETQVAGVELSRWLALAAHILMLLALVGIYLVQANESGAWGLVGFLLAFTGVAIFIGYVVGGWTATIPEPRLGPIGGLLWISGLLILAVATWQTGVLTRWVGIIWLVGAVVYATGLPAGPQDTPRATAIVGALIVAVGFTWAGTSMLTLDQDSMCQSPDPVGRSS
jgi:hypothetical protein